MVLVSCPARYLLCSLAVFLLPGCAPAHPITEATCIMQCRDLFRDGRALMWSPDPLVERLLLDWAREQEVTVIDPAQVQDAMREQHLILEQNPELDQELRYLGKYLGADHILVATVVRDSHPLTRMYSGYKEGHPRVTTVFDPTVIVRSLGVDRPTLYWSVTARGPAPTFFLDLSITGLTQTALQRATCEADRESRWTDEAGCTKNPRGPEN